MVDASSDVTNANASPTTEKTVVEPEQVQKPAETLKAPDFKKSPTQPIDAPAQSLDFILDIPLKVTAELGRAKMPIREILQLAQGSVIELSKFAGEPLEILINDKLIARGEVVVVNEKFGIRLTDIISPIERIEQLK
jgi:flagellar motor switch protein FliN/FliY